MRPTQTKIEWHRYKKGESFFIPTLTPAEVRIKYLLDAQQELGRRAGVTAKIGCYNGMLGVMFKR